MLATCFLATVFWKPVLLAVDLETEFPEFSSPDSESETASDATEAVTVDFCLRFAFAFGKM